ncbi:glycosyl hydrolase family 18 protein [Paenibacillus tarimensis]|uniref:glycosyl hydrolase family 18 protein n=1 Tax=Paenibacillus tarimensis TaxID=416012 RepID=UPI001F338562|nr:glycosyl hydrolase family 18 protein [Paenibacillus tarimensis]MCF2942638.1 glycosyl hydrolase family 18 protein [Paenibacillus tarimensis]
MNNKIKLGLTLLLALQAGALAATSTVEASAGKMTQYRVYQNEKALKEFPSLQQAVAYSKQFKYSHVEKIANRQWVWDNLPRYALYQNGLTRSSWGFQTLAEARQAASSLTNVHIRDLEKPGWVYSRHTRYRLYQGDKTMPQWAFVTLAEAKKEAAKWGSAHIMDTDTNQWIWDNISTEQKEAARSKAPVYEVITADGVTSPTTHSFLLDAIRASNKSAGSEVVNMTTGDIVHSAIPAYTIYQNGKEVRSYYGLDNAVTYAKTLAGAEIVKDGNVWWTNIPYLQVYQGDKLIRHFHTRSSALSYARSYANSKIVTSDGRLIWDNMKKLLYLGWNGSSSTTTIMGQVAATQGMDINSPTWFELTDASGTLKDTSDAKVVAELIAKGMQVVPLVHNQFDKAMTSTFLRSPEAQKRFISALVDRLVKLQVHGVNLDFEELAGADRDLYTVFVRDLAKAVKAKGLSISIDLLRGDAAWNHKTAYDHEKLASYVDYVVIMAYDQYWKGSTSPGSVAGLQWTEQGVKEYLSYGIPRSKLMLGIPFYIREWKIDNNGRLLDSRAIFMKDLPALLHSNEATSVYDPKFQQIKHTYVKDGFTYVLWAETVDTVKKRIEIAKKYDLAGVAAWRLGYESPELWTMMLQIK